MARFMLYVTTPDTPGDLQTFGVLIDCFEAKTFGGAIKHCKAVLFNRLNWLSGYLGFNDISRAVVLKVSEEEGLPLGEWAEEYYKKRGEQKRLAIEKDERAELARLREKYEQFLDEERDSI